MSLEERLEQAEKLVAEVKAELAAMRATKRNWPERIEAGMVFGISEGGMECQYIVSDASRLVCIASNTPGMIGGKWNSESLFRGSEDRFTYLGRARDILTIRTDAHEPTGAELVGKYCEYSADGMDWDKWSKSTLLRFHPEGIEPFERAAGVRTRFSFARLAK